MDDWGKKLGDKKSWLSIYGCESWLYDLIMEGKG
jgi:hypothetical protein